MLTARPGSAGISFGQAAVDPSHQVAIGQIANEQEQAVGGLVQAAIAQRVQRQRTGGEMGGLIAGPADLAIPAVVKMPVALQLGARWYGVQICRDAGPGQNAVAVHVLAGNGISDPLVTERWHNPVEQLERIMRFDGGQDPGLKQVVAQVVDQERTACQAANRVDEFQRVGVAFLPGQSPGRLAHRT
jgi:hypothetical protein